MIQNFRLLELRTQIPITQIQFIPKFLLPHEINAIQDITKTFEFQDAKVLGNIERSNLILRRSSIKVIEGNEKTAWIYEKMLTKVQELNQLIWQFDLYGINEYLQYTEYHGDQSNRGHFDWHMDIADVGIISNRKLSFECILDDNHTGGEFSILLGAKEHKVKMNKGDAVVFPSFYMNKIYPVLTGKRTSIVNWISGPSFK